MCLMLPSYRKVSGKGVMLTSCVYVSGDSMFCARKKYMVDMCLF